MIVRSPVYLDNEAFGKAAKIGNIWPNWVLPSELEAMRALAQPLPQHTFGHGQIFPQLAS